MEKFKILKENGAFKVIKEMENYTAVYIITTSKKSAENKKEELENLYKGDK
jgi:hypothetical protein